MHSALDHHIRVIQNVGQAERALGPRANPYSIRKDLRHGALAGLGTVEVGVPGCEVVKNPQNAQLGSVAAKCIRCQSSPSRFMETPAGLVAGNNRAR